MRILIVTDAWYPQINGVVRTLTAMRDELTRMGDTVHMLTPEGLRSIPCPTYPEIPLSLVTARNVEKVVQQFMPCAIHIATEGPLGLAARRFCRKLDIPYTSAFHTRFPEYIEARFKIPANWIYPTMRWFHGKSSTVMAPTPTVVENLKERNFRNVQLWGRGVDVEMFKPGPAADIPNKSNGPVLLSVGRVAVEKNIGAFLDLEIEGKKVVVGDGPQRTDLEKRYPDVLFVGAKHGEELVSYYNAADVFVFPSQTDTFGLVMLEALACGVPVAANPVMGPKDVITDEKVGCLHEELAVAVNRALSLNRQDCRQFAIDRSWENCAKTFRSYLHEFDPELLHGILTDGTAAPETASAE